VPALAASPPPSLSPSPLAGGRRDGRYEGGAYHIEVPPNWNGGLVLFAHGIQYDRVALVDLPISQVVVRSGYAWAASSYRDKGYIPHLAVEDMLALRRVFEREVGRPRWTILYGQSMGGHVVTASLELHPGMYQAALAECGGVDGIWEADYLMAYTAAAEYISGIRFLDAADRQAFGRMQGEWIRVMGTPGAYTDKGQHFDSVVKYLMGGDLPMRIEGLKPRYLANLTQREDPITSQNMGQRNVDTRQLVYQIDPGLGLSADELNANVRRATAPPGVRTHEQDPVYAELTGKITVPLLTLHTTGDGWVPFSHEQRYRQRTMQAGTTDLLVQRAIRRPSHCDFNNEEREQAFDDLVNWLERGVKPAGDDVLTADLMQIGLRWTKPLHPEDPAAKR